MNKIYIIVFFFIVSCTTQKIDLFIEYPNEDFIQYELNQLKDTVFGGNIIFTHSMYGYTFISTDSINVTIYDHHNLNVGDSIFIIYKDSTNNNINVTITWGVKKIERKIVR